VAGDARVSFDLGGDVTAVELRKLELTEGGGFQGLPSGQTLEQGTVELPGHDWPRQAHVDFKSFMLATETAFYRKTKSFLKNELGVRVPITPTQANYQPASITEEVADYADMHAYWHHPVFPGRPWDRENWTVANETLVAFPFHNTWPRVNLLMRSGWRFRGKPFTFSEWNTGEPGFFSADAIPAAALVASLQDWDAVFFFDYHGSAGGWDVDEVHGYFDINGQPVKTALLPALANLYRRGDLPPLKQVAVAGPGLVDRLGALGLCYRVSMDPDVSTEEETIPPSPEALNSAVGKRIESPDGTVVWDVRNPDRAHVLINVPATRCVWGLVAGEEFSLGDWRFAFGEIERDYAVLVATSRDGEPLSQSRSVLITVAANSENLAMGWNEDRTSVGTHWGHGPTQVNGVPVALRVPAGRPAARLFALDSAGQRRHEVGSQLEEDCLRFELGPRWHTLFYELSRE